MSRHSQNLCGNLAVLTFLIRLSELSQLTSVRGICMRNDVFWNSRVGSYMATGSAAHTVMNTVATPPKIIALDTETAGTDGIKRFHTKCVTASWWHSDTDVMSVIVEPHDLEGKALLRALCGTAETLVLHNAPFDIPPLYHYGWIALDDVLKVADTLVLARMGMTSKQNGRALEDLAPVYGGIADSDISMRQLFGMLGHTQVEGWQAYDASTATYRIGAMSDTAATLRLYPQLRRMVRDYLTNTPFAEEVIRAHGTRDMGAIADYLINREQRTNQIMLRRSALGLAVNMDYLTQYLEKTGQEYEQTRGLLYAHGMESTVTSSGDFLMEVLAAQGIAGDDWPRTATGKLAADKKTLEAFSHIPLVNAHLKSSNIGKIIAYLEKIKEHHSITGRVHPEVNVLGASATGRMSYSEPPLQQFPADARPIICSDSGREWVSVDWSSIEPVIIANVARDDAFIESFEAGNDLYMPLTSDTVTRKQAKVLLLGALYGRGNASIAREMGVTLEEAKAKHTQMFAPMPRVASLIDTLRITSAREGCISTADGRLLTIAPDPKTGEIHGYKGVNYFVQGSAYSALSEAINAVADAGLGDAIQIAIHDELVFDRAYLDQIRPLMSTPPYWLRNLCQRNVIFRTDANDLSTFWQYV